jgi:hypothetical protein
MAGLSLVTSAGRDDLDAEIKRAEEAHRRADAQYKEMNDRVSHSEAVAMLRVVKQLEKRAEVLRARKFAIIHGADEVPVAQTGPTHRVDDDELRKLIDARIERHKLSARREYRAPEVKYRVQVTKHDAHGRILEFEKVPMPIREPVDSK